MAQRGMPARFMEGAPKIVKDKIVDLIKIIPPAPLDFDVILRDVDRDQVTGIDFDIYGSQGCHFFLTTFEMRQYRERNRRKRIAWKDLPKATQESILSYLTSD